MVEESNNVEQSAPVEESTVNVEKGGPSIIMDKEVASDMASKASGVNDIESSDPVEQGLNKGLKMSGVAGEPVAAPKGQIAPVSTKDGKTSARVSPVADVPADAQVKAEGSSPSASSEQEDVKDEPKTVEEKEPVKESEPEKEPVKEEQPKEEPVKETEPEKTPVEEKEPEKVEEPEKEPEKVEEPEKEPEKIEEPEKVEEPEKEPEKVEEPEKEPENVEEEQQTTEEQESENESNEESEPEQEEYTPFGDPLRNVVNNMPQNVPIDRKTQADSEVLLTDIPGKLRIY